MSQFKRTLKARITIWIVAIVVVVFGFGGLALRALMKVQSGDGLDTYHTGKLVEFNYVGILIALGVAVVALCVGLLLRGSERLANWRLNRELRQSRKRNV